MAVWHIDNFKGWGTGTTGITRMLQGIYAEVYQYQARCRIATDPQNEDELALYVQGILADTVGIRIVHPDGGQSQMGARIRFYAPELSNNSTTQFIQLLNSAGGVVVAVHTDTIGRLHILAGGNTFSTPAPAITAGGWYNIELLADQTNVELRVEDVPVIGPVEHGISSPTYTQFRTVANNPQANVNNRIYYIKDLVLTDGNGSYNVGFVGTKLIADFDVVSDAELNWSVTGAATGAAVLNRPTPDDTGVYISAGDSPIPDAYRGTLDQLPSDATSVAAVLTRVRAYKSDGGDGGLQVGVVSDPEGADAVATGKDRPITTTATYWQDVFEEDPATSSGWTVPAVNDIEIQINRTV